MDKTVYMAPERVDRSSAVTVQEELDKLIEDGALNIVFDMTNLQYISSAGLRVLLATQQRLQEEGSFILTNVPSAVKEILDVTGFSSFLLVK